MITSVFILLGGDKSITYIENLPALRKYLDDMKALRVLRTTLARMALPQAS